MAPFYPPTPRVTARPRAWFPANPAWEERLRQGRLVATLRQNERRIPIETGVACSFGISEFTSYPWSFERDLERYAAHGADAIEVCEFKLNRNDYAPQFALLKQSGLFTSSVQTTVHSLFPDSLAPEPRDPNARLQHIASSIERIAPLVPPNTPFVVITGAAPGGDCKGVYDYAVDALRSLAGCALELGVRIAFEPLNPILFNTDTALWGLDDALELVERVAHPALGICLDTWNVFQTPAVERVIARCGPRIFLVQVSDWRRPYAAADRRPLGDGSIPNHALFRAIRNSGYGGPYVLEIFSAETVPDSVWAGNIDEAIDRSVTAFERIWEETAA